MPSATKSKKKRPVAKKKKVLKSVKKKATRAMKKKVVAKAKKKVIAKAKKAAVRKILKKEITLGRVTHYYDRLGVAIVDLAMPVRLGDVVHFKRGTHEHVQPITSLQIDHQAVTGAKKKDIVGLKVMQEVHPGAVMMPGNL